MEKRIILDEQDMNEFTKIFAKTIEDEAIKEQAKGLLKGAAKFQVSMSIAYGLLNPAFDKPIVFYFEKFKKDDKKYNK